MSGAGAVAVLLLGPRAEALAERLEASGYRPLRAAAAAAEAQLVVLDAEQQGRIPALRQQLPGVPLLLEIAHDTVDDRSHCLASGADDFWLSCAGPSDLLMRLRLHLTLVERSAGSGECLRLADLEVWPLHRRVRRGGRDLELTDREAQLLLLLLRRAGTVVSRDTIQAEIWPEGQPSNVIEVYVRYLRRKLEAHGGCRLVHTVRGKGYSLAERWP
ncbi:MAG: response regulator transcription factor [Cyanobacteriota bacterium]|nr:response regulator transcription factor [Cyanobacteriota bacterium]